MWRWLQEKLPEYCKIFGSLWLISCSVHIVLLCSVLFFSSVTDRHSLVVSTARRTNNARIVLLPMIKTVQGTQLASSNFVQQDLAEKLKKTKPAVKKQIVKKPAKKPAVQKKPVKTQVAKSKPITKSKPSTTLASKSEPVKKQKPQHIPAARQNKTPSPVPVKKTEKSAQAHEEIMYVGRDDLRALRIQRVVADALQKNWRPPSGISHETTCTIRFSVGKDGKVSDLCMQNGSEILIFDVAARTAVMQAHFSPAAHGKQFTVAFKP